MGLIRVQPTARPIARASRRAKDQTFIAMLLDTPAAELCEQHRRQAATEAKRKYYKLARKEWRK